ncbi:ras-related protein Rab-7a-like [Antedon mediterranea]|uniref:ras-related protein Rab-7a-like n=1 Tax=Antedon mediterranea TaxID=105859 RepID=UPI003AF48FCF
MADLDQLNKEKRNVMGSFTQAMKGLNQVIGENSATDINTVNNLFDRLTTAFNSVMKVHEKIASALESDADFDNEQKWIEDVQSKYLTTSSRKEDFEKKILGARAGTQIMKEVLLKIILLGEHNVGKTALINQYVNNTFSDKSIPTVGTGINETKVLVDNRPVNIEIWDTAGQELFKSLPTTFFRKAHGCVLVFDVTSDRSNSRSFESLESYYTEVLNRTSTDIPFVVIGNKIDLKNRTVVTKQMAHTWCKKYSIPYFETSAKNNIQVKEAFQTIAKSALAQKPEQDDNEIIKLEENTSKQDGRGGPDGGSWYWPRCC